MRSRHVSWSGGQIRPPDHGTPARTLSSRLAPLPFPSLCWRALETATLRPLPQISVPLQIFHFSVWTLVRCGVVGLASGDWRASFAAGARARYQVRRVECWRSLICNLLQLVRSLVLVFKKEKNFCGVSLGRKEWPTDQPFTLRLAL